LNKIQGKLKKDVYTLKGEKKNAVLLENKKKKIGAYFCSLLRKISRKENTHIF
jgi:hypothetical protein